VNENENVMEVAKNVSVFSIGFRFSLLIRFKYINNSLNIDKSFGILMEIKYLAIVQHRYFYDNKLI